MSQRISVYLPKDIDKDSIVFETARRFANGENGGLRPKLEHWYGVDYLVLRYSGAGRILFQLVTINNEKQVLLFHAFTPTHDYEECTRNPKFKLTLPNVPKDYELLLSDVVLSIENAQTKLIEWHQQLQITSSVQSEAVETALKKQVSILSGPPGAGKSLAIFTALQEIVKHDESATILFVCETPGLVQYFQNAWKAWYCAPKNKTNKVDVTFSSYEKAIPALLLDEERYNHVITQPKKIFMIIFKMYLLLNHNENCFLKSGY